jgi:hypothetical protein
VVDNSRAWMLFVGLRGLVGGAGQIGYTLKKGHIFNPWSRDNFENTSCLFWLAMAGSIGGILLGAVLILLALS